MAALSLEDFDQYIENLQAQVRFLRESLDATDHNAPDWLATDLISLRNKSGRLQDDMKRFRDQLESEELATKKVKSNKRLSLEGSKTARSKRNSDVATRPRETVSPPPDVSPLPSEQPERSEQPEQTQQSEPTYVVQHVDVTDEVNRRLRESRLRRLMDSPSTSQKRKYDAFEDIRIENRGQEEDNTSAGGVSEKEMSPSKRLKISGTFESILKRKENGIARGDPDERSGERADFKKRRL